MPNVDAKARIDQARRDLIGFRRRWESATGNVSKEARGHIHDAITIEHHTDVIEQGLHFRAQAHYDWTEVEAYAEELKGKVEAFSEEIRQYIKDLDSTLEQWKKDGVDAADVEALRRVLLLWIQAIPQMTFEITPQNIVTLVITDDVRAIRQKWSRESSPAPAEPTAEEKEAARSLLERDRQREEQKKQKRDEVQAACNAKVEAYKAALDAQVEKSMAAYREGLLKQIAALEQELNAQEEALSELGFFAFGEKKAAKEKIADLTGRIEGLQNPKTLAREKKRLADLAEQALAQYTEQVQSYLYNRFPGLVPKTSKYVIPSGTPDSFKWHILTVMRPGFRYSPDEIVKLLSDTIQGVTESAVEQMMKIMYLSDETLYRTNDRGHYYFTLTSEGERWLRNLEAASNRPDYTEVEEYANTPCPEPPSLEAVFG